MLEWKYNTPGTVMDVPSPPAIAGGRNIYFGGAGEDEAAVTSVRSTRRAILKWRYLPAAIRPLHRLAATARQAPFEFLRRAVLAKVSRSATVRMKIGAPAEDPAHSRSLTLGTSASNGA